MAMEGRQGQVVAGCPLIEQGLDVGFGVYAAATGDVVGRASAAGGGIELLDGRLSTEAISSMNAPVPPAQLPFMRISATSSAPVVSLARKKIILASWPPSSMAQRVRG